MYTENGYIFGQLKLNLKIDDRVIIGRTSSSDLDGKQGTILGMNFSNVVDAYIVLLDDPLPTAKAISIIEVCLSKIETGV